jgi:glycosyltransferase involved in cell wall biosynthesis
MKILIVNWSWYPTGGDWTYISNLIKLYENNGHEVLPLSTMNEKNVNTNYPEYFIKSLNYKKLKKRNIFDGIKVIRNSIVSFDALRKVDEIIATHDINIVHLHNIHHYITPSIIWKFKNAGIKIIWSLHDCKIICPDSLFVSNGKICERCITGNFYECALNKCKKESLQASILASVEAYFYHKSGIYKNVDAFLCPSDFIRRKFEQFGFDKEKLHVTNLTYDISIIDDYIEKRNENIVPKKTERQILPYILYIGRMEKIKGVGTLINAVKGTGINLKIIGSGEEFKDIQEMLLQNNIVNIELLGYMDKLSVFEFTMNAKFVICPSECYENYPFSIIESFLFSKPVIGSRIGGIPELVIDEVTGYLFEPGNFEDLRKKILKLYFNENVIQSMGSNARKYIKEIVNFKMHWSKLSLIINTLIQNDE